MARIGWLSGLLLLAFIFPLSQAAGADGVVTECTEEALQSAIADALAGDHIVSFDCDGTLLLTNGIVLANEDPEFTFSLTLDGTGHRLTISGSTAADSTNGVRLFWVDPGVTFTLVNLTLANGQSTNGGALYNLGTSILIDCVLSNNLALGTNGRSGRTSSTNASVLTGHKGGDATPGQPAAGGAIYNLGTLALTQCAFLTNRVIGGAGGPGGAGQNGLAAGGDGGRGGRGGSAFGGAICNDATKTSRGHVFATNCSFHSNLAAGGTASDGGAGGSGSFSGFSGSGGMGGAADGAAIYNKGSLTIVASTFALNDALGGHSAAAGSSNLRGKRGPNGGESLGGGVCNLGTSTNVNCTFFSNTTSGGDAGNGGNSLSEGGRGGDGGGAWGGNVYSASFFAATNCTFSDGGAIGGGGGHAGSGPFSGKNGTHGVSRGGNLSNRKGKFVLKNCLMAFPVSGTSVSRVTSVETVTNIIGSITNITTTTNVTTVTNTVVSGNGYGSFVDSGFNLSSDSSIRFTKNSGSFITNDVKIGLLAQNGGPVETVELLAGSPAIDAGDPNFSLANDARGVGRPQGIHADVGAYEAGQRLLAPVIESQPANQIAQVGGTATFRVVATGDPPLQYQWQLRAVGGSPEDIDGATNSILTVTDVTTADEGEYDVIVSNNSGSTNSAFASLSVVTPPAITEQPADIILDSGDSFTLTVTATGDEPLSYHWLTNGVPIPGAVLSTYSVVGAAAKDAADYQVSVCNPYACVTSDVAHVVVNSQFTLPTILQQPASVNGFTGDNATFSVTAIGLGLSYQWLFNDTNLLAGATNATLTLGSAQLENNGAYRAVVTNVLGSATSAPASLNLTSSVPLITVQPISASAEVGSNVTFSVSVVGSKPFLYQWLLNDVPLSNPTNSTLLLTNSVSGSLQLISNTPTGSVLTITLVRPTSGTYTPADEGTYQVNILNGLGATLSDQVLLDVLGFGVGN